MHIRHIKIGMVLSKDLADDCGNLLLEKGISLTQTYINRLKQLGITTVPVENPKESDIQLTSAITLKLRSELADCFCNLFNAETRSLASSPLSPLEMSRIKTATGQILDEIEVNLPNILNLQVREPSADETAHAVNVCLLSVITGMYLKIPRHTLNELALGALLHDVGKLMVSPPKIQTDILSQLHTQYGHDMLLKNKFSSIVTTIALEHHERYDGTGFPSGLRATSIHPLSRLVAIANHFDHALTQASANAIPRTEVIEEMLASGNTAFDLNLLKAFFRNIAIYPVGSLVLLNTGQQGYVVKNHSHFPLRPQIQLSKEFGELSIDLIHKPTLTIVDWIEG